MDQAIKDQWVKDLRSGEFQQGKGALESEEGFCCLGILCFRAAEAGITERRAPTIGSAQWYGETQTVLPTEVMRWAGLIASDDDLEYTNAKRGHYTDNEGYERWLTMDNDDGYYDFQAIADIIEEYF